MRNLVLFHGMLKRYAIELRRNVVNTISLVLTIYLFFVVIFFGSRFFGGAAVGESTGVLVVAFMVWALALFAFMDLTMLLMQEAQEGTLEQLGMSPFGLGRVLFARVAASLLFYSLVMFALLLLMLATTRTPLNAAVLPVFLLSIVTVVSISGVGFLLGGMALVFKQVQHVFPILQFVIAAFIIVPLDQVPWFKVMPLSWGAHLIRQVMIEGATLRGLGVENLAFLVGVSAFYLAAGFLVFRAFESRARNLGALGHY